MIAVTLGIAFVCLSVLAMAVLHVLGHHILPTQCLPKSQLFIVPGATHVTMVFEKSPLVGGVVVDFLDAKDAKKN